MENSDLAAFVGASILVLAGYLQFAATYVQRVDTVTPAIRVQLAAFVALFIGGSLVAAAVAPKAIGMDVTWAFLLIHTIGGLGTAIGLQILRAALDKRTKAGTGAKSAAHGIATGGLHRENLQTKNAADARSVVTELDKSDASMKD
jgi:hypothetical protein